LAIREKSERGTPPPARCRYKKRGGRGRRKIWCWTRLANVISPVSTEKKEWAAKETSRETPILLSDEKKKKRIYRPEKGNSGSRGPEEGQQDPKTYLENKSQKIKEEQKQEKNAN